LENNRLDAATLLLALTAGALTLARGDFSYLTTLIGGALLLVLFTYDRGGYRSFGQSLAFAAVAGFCFMLAGRLGLQWLLSQSQPTSPSNFELWLSLTWIVASLIFVIIDRVRMSSRETLSLRSAPSMPVSIPPFPVPQPTAARPVVTDPLEKPAEKPLEQVPVAPETSSNFEPATPPPAAIPVPSGKQVSIYLNLIGEGLNVLRTVNAEHLGRDFYRILDEVPPGETWEFLPGQIVRCKKKNLSNGKGLVAFEEAPRAL
jgi:hypothetical protein